MIWMGAILAGGASSRFGADKAMADLAGTPLIVRVAHALGAPALAVVGNPAGAALLGAKSLCDPPNAVRGPLAGVLAALDWAEASNADWLVTAPCDTPLLPRDIAMRLIEAGESAGANAAHACTGEGVHALCAAWRPRLAPVLRAHFEAGVHPPVRALAPEAVLVTFHDEQAFVNVNTADDFARAVAALKGG